MKKCSKCKKLLAYECFCKCSKSKTGFQSQCKTCKVQSVIQSPSYKGRKNFGYEKTEARRLYKRKYHHKTKLSRNISRRMRQSLNGERKSLSWTAIVGYSIFELRSHLESKFVLGMNWDNYGSVWHIDHIKPISSFNITSIYCEDFIECWSLSNLQPLFKHDNLLKSNKY